MGRFRNALTLWVVLWCLPNSSWQISASEDVARFSSASSLLVVELPVRDLKRGQPLVGLRAEDFEVYDRGEKREIVGFEVLDRRLAPTDEQIRGKVETSQSRTPRTWLMVFDLAYADGLSLTKALSATSAFIADQVGPGDSLGVGFFSALRGLKLVASPSQRTDQQLAALLILEALLAHDTVEVERLASQRVASDDALVATHQELRAEAGIMIRADPYWPHRSVIRRFARDLSALAATNSALPGQRTLVLFSHGFETKYLMGRGSAGTLSQLESAFKSCRRNGWTIQTINAGGLRALGGRESLFYLAHETGGDSYENFNDLPEALRLMQLRGSVTYVLAFQVDQPEPDGTFHRLRVVLRDPPRGVRVLHRPGYQAPERNSLPSLDTPTDRR